MSQILSTGDGKFLTVDRSWRDAGEESQYALIGGQKVMIKAGGRAKPAILQKGEGFYYEDGSPVTELEHVAHLPKKFREMAEKFINGGRAVPLKPVVSKAEAVEQAVKRGRGRPPKVGPKSQIEVKDAQSFGSFMGPDEA